MALFDSNIDTTTLSKSNEVYINYTDGGFYPFLKYFINKVTGIPNSNIFNYGYGENNPFLTQDKKISVFLKIIMYNSPMLSGGFDGDGNAKLFMETAYRIYIVNDNFISPFLIEAALKVDKEGLNEICSDFKDYAKKYGYKVFTPQRITMKSPKSFDGFSLLPIVIIDLSMNGFVSQNIEYLKNVLFDKVNIDNAINLKTRSQNG